MKGCLQKTFQEILNKNNASDAWSMRRSSQIQQPVYYIEDCHILNLGSQTSVLKTQKASLHYCTRPAKNVFCTVEWTKTDPRLFDAMICQIHLHSAKIYLNWGLQNSTRPFLCQCSSQCPWVLRRIADIRTRAYLWGKIPTFLLQSTL